MTDRSVYSVAKLAERLGLNRKSVYEAVDRHEIPQIRIGRRIVLPKQAIDLWLLAGQVPPEAA